MTFGSYLKSEPCITGRVTFEKCLRRKMVDDDEEIEVVSMCVPGYSFAVRKWELCLYGQLMILGPGRFA